MTQVGGIFHLRSLNNVTFMVAMMLVIPDCVIQPYAAYRNDRNCVIATFGNTNRKHQTHVIKTQLALGCMTDFDLDTYEMISIQKTKEHQT